MIRLQLAADTLSLEETMDFLKDTASLIDIVEVGTPLLYRSGLKAVSMIREAFPDLYILCDSKIIDAGAYESREQFEAGADCVSVLGITDDATIRACVEEARKYQREISADTICIRNLSERIRQVEALGVDYISVHTGVDQQAQGRTPLDDLKEIKSCVKRAGISVAGGIRLSTVNAYLELGPDVVIVGNGILGQPDPKAAARALGDRIHQYFR